jgi:uncharacterized membrane protein YphA (DoxX/SURF4 family)
LTRTQSIGGGLFLLRIALGGVFLAAGVLKVGSPNLFAETIAAFRILPQFFIAPLAIGLPLFEIGLGLYLLLGLFTRVAAIVAGIELLVFAAAIASIVVRGISINCGCFGEADSSPASWLDVLRDLVLAALTLPLIFVGPGAFALDRRMQKTSEEVS